MWNIFIVSGKPDTQDVSGVGSIPLLRLLVSVASEKSRVLSLDFYHFDTNGVNTMTTNNLKMGLEPIPKTSSI